MNTRRNTACFRLAAAPVAAAALLFAAPADAWRAEGVKQLVGPSPGSTLKANLDDGVRAVGKVFDVVLRGGDSAEVEAVFKDLMRRVSLNNLKAAPTLKLPMDAWESGKQKWESVKRGVEAAKERIQSTYGGARGVADATAALARGVREGAGRLVADIHEGGRRVAAGARAAAASWDPPSSPSASAASWDPPPAPSTSAARWDAPSPPSANAARWDPPAPSSGGDSGAYRSGVRSGAPRAGSYRAALQDAERADAARRKAAAERQAAERAEAARREAERVAAAEREAAQREAERVAAAQEEARRREAARVAAAQQYEAELAAERRRSRERTEIFNNMMGQVTKSINDHVRIIQQHRQNRGQSGGRAMDWQRQPGCNPSGTTCCWVTDGRLQCGSQ